MDPIANIQKYKRSFNRLSQNSENMFKTYLKVNKLSKMEFLYQLGLNEGLINEHNFQEIEDLVSLILPEEQFPVISYPLEGETLAQDNLSIYNPVNKQDLVIGPNFIRFNICNREEVNNTNETITHISYILENNRIRKVDITINLNWLTDQIDQKSTFINPFAINAEQTEYDLNGNPISNNDYSVKINCRVNRYLFQTIYRELTRDSIIPGIATILGLIEHGKLKKEDLEIDLNISELLKK